MILHCEGRKKAHIQNMYKKGVKHDVSKHIVIVVVDVVDVVVAVIVGGGWILLNWLSVVCCLYSIVHTNTESHVHHQKFFLPNTANELQQQRIAGIVYPILMLVFLRPNIFATANYFDPTLELPARLCTHTNTHAKAQCLCEFLVFLASCIIIFIFMYHRNSNRNGFPRGICCR